MHIDVKKTEGLTIHWSESDVSFYPVAYLRKHSPSADNRILQQEMKDNPLTVLPADYVSDSRNLRIDHAEMVGHYAIRLTFSDGHSTGLFSWTYLREIDPNRERPTMDSPPSTAHDPRESQP